MIFPSAGHNTKGIRPDSGAVANGFTEAQLAVEFRNLVVKQLQEYRAKFITDFDDERLAQYLERIKTGTGSVVLEFHFDASPKPEVSGTMAIVGSDADRLDVAFAKEVVNVTSRVLGINNRGVISETASHRGRLGLMRESGIVSLLEICFITNKYDLKLFHAKKVILADEIAKILIRYDALI